jgi:hypothetical protein
LYRYIWQSTDARRSVYLINLIFNEFISLLKKNREYFDNKTLENLKQIIFIGSGIVAGLKPCDDEIQAPIDFLQKTYVKDYKLLKYIPSIMASDLFDGTNPIYYSLQWPSLMETSLPNKTLRNTILELNDLKHAIERFRSFLNDGSIELSNSSLKFFLDLKIEFFHTYPDLENDIKSTKDLPKTDKRFLYSNTFKKNKDFCYSGSLLRGIVKLSK